MMQRARRRLAVVTALVLAVAGVVVGAAPAVAHQDGAIELWVGSADFEASAAGVHVRVELVDRDSGSEAPGFAASAVVVDGGGEVVDRVILDETSAGTYEADLALGPGTWEVTISADQGDSPLPALKADREFELMVDETGGVEVVSGGGGSAVVIVVAIVVPVVLIAALLALLWWRRSRTGDEAGDARPTVKKL